MEPKEDAIDYTFLDRVLKETHDSAQKLAFRVMCCSTSAGVPYHPEWLREIGGKELRCDYQGVGSFPIPDMDDPIVLKKHLDFIQRLGSRYDGHPDIDHVDLGSIGWWGEWHLSGSKRCSLPTLQNRMKVVDAYLTAFKKTPLIMLIGGEECTKYAVQRGAGWRADCLGDMGGFSRRWSHMRNGYPGWFRAAGLQNVWKTSPVAWESCWDMNKWVNEGWSLRYIFNYALALHGSCINNKSAPLPQGDEVRPEVERFLRRLGYRFVLKELKHPASIKAGEKLTVSMQWQNIGSAPCYRPYRVAYRLASAGANGYAKVFTGRITVNRWLSGSVDLFTPEFFKSPPDLPPGEVTAVAEDLVLPLDMPSGNYVLSVAVVGDDSAPVVRLAIKGRGVDGWYPVSTLKLD